MKHLSKQIILSYIAIVLWSGVPGNLFGAVPIQLDKDVRMKARDGITLRADIFRPLAEGKFPVLLQRTPYDKGNWGNYSAVRLASEGYVVILQDTRGRFTSDGDFYPFLYETQDGYDAVEWAASLPYSNGKVGMYGVSYVGATQWLAAIGLPPHLVAISPGVTASDYYQGWVYRGGAFELWFSGSWTNYSLVPNTVFRRIYQLTHPFELMKTLPLNDYSLTILPNASSLAPYFRDWLENESDGDYWSRWSIDKNHASLKLPAYIWGGWYDFFVDGTIKNFSQLKKLHPETPLYLTVGPWTHYPVGPSVHKWGQLDFGPSAGFDHDAELLRWSDLMLKGVDDGFSKRAPVKIFVMGENVWREEQEWPLKRSESVNYYLDSGSHANSSSGDGRLSKELPIAETADQFVYDPANPVPTTGGQLCCESDIIPPGPFDQSQVETRPDVLVYSTPPLPMPLEVTGPLQTVLYVSSDAPDTDFTAKLVDVHPNGKAYNLSEGILRMRRREGLNTLAPPMHKDQIYRIEIDLAPTSNLFQAGHRIRLEVSSSNFPRFDRNLNTGEPLIRGREFHPARNLVHHDKAHLSALVLPIVPRRK